MSDDEDANMVPPQSLGGALQELEEMSSNTGSTFGLNTDVTSSTVHQAHQAKQPPQGFFSPAGERGGGGGWVGWGGGGGGGGGGWRIFFLF